MSEQRLKCADTYPSNPGTPFYNQCWGFRELPASLNFEVTGIREVIPGSACVEMYGGSSFTGQLTRMGPCEFVYNWTNGKFGIALAMNENRPPLSTHIDQNNEDLSNWRVGGSMVEISKTAYCSMSNPPLGAVRFEMSGVISNDVCEADFRIWVEE
jgi:hypothetical protein